jgi:tocopherol O-methyltransferase
MPFETKVREYYNQAIDCYQKVMGDRWHFGDPQAEANGASPIRACEVLEEQVIALSGVKPGGWGLDFGSGVGGPTCHMTKVSGASFVGVTNNDRCTQQARQSAAALGLAGKAHFITLDDTGYTALPFPDGCFDVVSFYDSVCHLPDKAAFFRQAARILKPGGRLVGSDWLQRAFGEYQTEEQIMKFMQPVNEFGVIPWHGTLEGYKKMMEDAGLIVSLARDQYEGVKCWNKVSDKEHEDWLAYEGAEEEFFRNGKKALDAARHAGVFTVGLFVAQKPL